MRSKGRLHSRGTGPHVRTASCVLMVVAAAGLMVGVALGAPLVSILIVGLLLLCPLLLWIPFRFEQRAGRTAHRESRP